MKYVINLNGSIKSYENTEQINQFSVNANNIYVAFDGLNIRDYVPYIAFERADGKTSPLIGMSFCKFTLNNTEYDGACYSFSDAWVTAISGELALNVILKRNQVTKYTSKINLFVSDSVDNDSINYIDDVAYSQLNSRLYNAEQDIAMFEEELLTLDASKIRIDGTDATSPTIKEKIEQVITETAADYQTKEDAFYNLQEAKEYAAQLTSALNRTKANKEEIPTKNSQLENDMQFVDNTVGNLVNYYSKNETYTQNEIKELIKSMATLDIRIVTELPTEDISRTTIYLLLADDGKDNNIYEEYIYANNRWEMIGNTKIEIPTKLSQFINDTQFTSRKFLEDNYVAIDYVKENNPTTILNGKWKFKGNNTNLYYTTKVYVYDSKGNVFTGLTFTGTKVIGHNENNGAEKVIYDYDTKTGLAYLDNSTRLDDKYYLQLYYYDSITNDSELLSNIVWICDKYVEADNLANHVSTECVKITEEPTPTSLTNGIWKFYEYSQVPKGTGAFYGQFKDTLGNEFSAIQVDAIVGNWCIEGFNGNELVMIYNPELKEGLAYESDNYYFEILSLNAYEEEVLNIFTTCAKKYKNKLPIKLSDLVNDLNFVTGQVLMDTIYTPFNQNFGQIFDKLYKVEDKVEILEQNQKTKLSDLVNDIKLVNYDNNISVFKGCEFVDPIIEGIVYFVPANEHDFKTYNSLDTCSFVDNNGKQYKQLQTIAETITFDGVAHNKVIVNGIDLEGNTHEFLNINTYEGYSTMTGYAKDPSFYVKFNSYDDYNINTMIRLQTICTRYQQDVVYPDVASKEYAKSLLGNAVGISFQLVSELPTNNILPNTIYLKPKQDIATNNIYNEYIYINGMWELIGDTQINVNDFASKDFVNEKIGDIESVLDTLNGVM